MFFQCAALSFNTHCVYHSCCNIMIDGSGNPYFFIRLILQLFMPIFTIKYY